MGLLDTLRRAVSQAPGGRALDEVERLHREVSQLYERGRYREAEVAARRLVELQGKEQGEDHPGYATALSNLALLLQRRGDLAGAEPLLNRALEIRKVALGEDHVDSATSLGNLAELLHLRGDLAGAEPLLRRVLEVRRQALGDQHPDYATSLTSLALLLQGRDDLAGAESLLRQALEIRRKSLGERHPHVASALSNLALLLQRRGDPDAAESHLRQALELRLGLLGDAHPDYAQSLNNLAALLWSRGRLAEAHDLYVAAGSILRGLLGEDHPDHATALHNLALLLRDLGNEADAEPHLRQAVAIREQTLGPEHPDTRSSADALASVRARGAGPLDRVDHGTTRPALVEDAVGVSSGPDQAPIDLLSDGRSLADDLDALSGRFQAAGTALLQAACQMEDPGLPPEAGILDVAAACGRDLGRVRTRACRVASSLALTIPASGSLGSLRELADFLATIARAEAERDLREEARRRARAVLDRVFALGAIDDPAASALEGCRAEASALRQQAEAGTLAEVPEAIRRIADGEHPLAALLGLVDGEEDLDDDTWADLHALVEGVFGKPLATAIARRRIVPSRIDGDACLDPGFSLIGPRPPLVES